MVERKPTTKAIAIVYNENESAAPKVVASGKGLIAEKIIAIATNNKIKRIYSKDIAFRQCRGFLNKYFEQRTKENPLL